MESEWPLDQIGKHADVYSGFAFKSTDLNEYGGIPVVKIKNVNHGIVDLTDTQFFPKNLVTQKHDKFFLKNGDVLIAMTGQGSVGRIGRLRLNNGEQVLLNQRVGKFVPQKTLFLEYFYYIASTHYYEQIFFNAGIGSGQPNLSPDDIKNIEIPIPPLEIQKNIAHILGSLDDKIELNRRMNATLEAMAQALFKSWFVDFDPVIDNALAAGHPIPEPLQERAEARAALGDQRQPLPEAIRQQFPNRFFCNEDMGWVPEGWKLGTLSDIAILSTKSVLPNKKPDKTWTHFSIPAFDEGQHPSFDLGVTIKSGKYLVPASAVLASKLNPQFPRVWMPVIEDERSAICSTEFMPFVPKEADERPFLYSLFCSDFVQVEIANRVTGSTGSRQRVKPKEIAELPLVIVPNLLRKAFSRTAGMLFSRKIVNKRQELSLIQLRDTLLPKLLSGQLRIPEAEQQVADML